MKFSFTQLIDTLDRMPMLKALIPLCVGILLSEWWLFPLWFLLGGLLLCGLLLVVRQHALFAVAMLLFFGGIVAGFRDGQATPPTTKFTTFHLQIEGLPAPRGDYTVTEGRICSWCDDRGHWHPAEEGIFVWCDSTYTPQTGEHLLCKGRIHPFSKEYAAYGALMRRRGYAGTLWVSQRAILSRDTSQQTVRFARRLHRMAAERIEALSLKPDNQAIVAAMAVGDRRGMTTTLRQAYARSGTSHLLAVSGLHVGIIFLAANALLWLLPAIRYGHRWRNWIVIALIWLYAATTGLSPSVIRAAFMFSALQFALATTKDYKSMNILVATAFIMLLFDARYLFDISFQLSFIAVAAIIAWGVPLFRRIHTRFRVLNALTGILVVGFVSTIATAPLVSHTFGIISLVGLLINPIVIALANVTVITAALWLITPFTLLSPLFEGVLNLSAGLQNFLVFYTSSWPWAALENTITVLEEALCYLCFVGVTLLIWSVKPKKFVHLR
ncbi:MAG: ComEC/Rec2 family competence protein [Alistipes sp.]